METKTFISFVVIIIVIIFSSRASVNYKNTDVVFSSERSGNIYSKSGSFPLDSNSKMRPNFNSNETKVQSLNDSDIDACPQSNNGIMNINEPINDCHQGYADCVAHCSGGDASCLQGCRSWYCACFAIHGQPCPVSPGPYFTSTYSGIKISENNTIQIGNNDTTTNDYVPFVSASPTIVSINVSVKGFAYNEDESSPINIGSASFNPVTGYYELTIPANSLSSLIGYPLIELDTQIIDPTIPSIPDVCNPPGQFTDVVFVQLSN